MNLKDFLMQADPVSALRRLVATGTLKNLEPSLVALKMEIPCGYHHKDNLEHSIRVLERAIEREPAGADLVLRTAALFHDVGKPATRKFGRPGEVTFQNHAEAGAKMLKKILKRHGYTLEERAQIEQLVSLHMRAYGFGEAEWSDSGVRRLATDAGSQEALDRLIIIFYSDLTTKNDRKRLAVERGIARLETALARVRAADARKALRPALDGHELMELTGLRPGKELGSLMKFLNRDEMVGLPRDEALAALREAFPTHFA